MIGFLLSPFLKAPHHGLPLPLNFYFFRFYVDHLNQLKCLAALSYPKFTKDKIRALFSEGDGLELRGFYLQALVNDEGGLAQNGYN